MRRKLALLVPMVLLIVLSGCSVADDGGDRVTFGGNVTLKDGETVEGDALVFGGNVTMEDGSEVEGDVVVFGGNVKIDGDVDGDVTTMGGNVNITDNATVGGEVSSVGGNVSVSDEASVGGIIADGLDVKLNFGSEEIVESESTASGSREAGSSERTDRSDRSDRGSMATNTGGAAFGVLSSVGYAIGDGVADVFWAMILSGVSVLLVLFFPKNINMVENTLTETTPQSLIVGFVTLIASLAVMGLFALLFWLLIPICGIFLVALALGAGMLAGWTVIGKNIGQRIFATFDNPMPSEVSATFLGVTVITLIANVPFLDHFPLIGWMFSFVGGLVVLVGASMGLGAVVLSRFGTQPYLPISSTATIDANSVASEVIEDSEIRDA